MECYGCWRVGIDVAGASCAAGDVRTMLVRIEYNSTAQGACEMGQLHSIAKRELRRRCSRWDDLVNLVRDLDQGL